MALLLNTSYGYITLDFDLIKNSSTIAAFLSALPHQPLTLQPVLQIQKDFSLTIPFAFPLQLPAEPSPSRFDSLYSVGIDSSGLIITLRARIESFDRKFCRIATIRDNYETINKISEIPVDKHGKPLASSQTPIIHGVYVLDDPFKALADVDAFNRAAIDATVEREAAGIEKTLRGSS